MNFLSCYQNYHADVTTKTISYTDDEPEEKKEQCVDCELEFWPWQLNAYGKCRKCRSKINTTK